MTTATDTTKRDLARNELAKHDEHVSRCRAKTARANQEHVAQNTSTTESALTAAVLLLEDAIGGQRAARTKLETAEREVEREKHDATMLEAKALADQTTRTAFAERMMARQAAAVELYRHLEALEEALEIDVSDHNQDAAHAEGLAASVGEPLQVQRVNVQLARAFIFTALSRADVRRPTAQNLLLRTAGPHAIAREVFDQILQIGAVRHDRDYALQVDDALLGRDLCADLRPVTPKAKPVVPAVEPTTTSWASRAARALKDSVTKNAGAHAGDNAAE